jgi:hypothetical protein
VELPDGVLLAPDAVPPPRSPSNFWKAELRFDSALDDKPPEVPESSSNWLSLRSLTSVCNAAMMPLCPYAATPVLAGAVVEAGALTGAGVPVVVPIEVAGAPLTAVVGAAVPPLAGAGADAGADAEAGAEAVLPLAGVEVDAALPAVGASERWPPPWPDRLTSRSAWNRS